MMLWLLRLVASCTPPPGSQLTTCHDTGRAIGPVVLAILAIVFVAGAAVTIWFVADRNANRDGGSKSG